MTPKATASSSGCGGRIVAIAPDSPAAIAGLRASDVLLAINGQPLSDVLDYQFHSSDERLVLRVERAGQSFSVRLEGGRALGIHFESPTFDGIRPCHNRCSFCFVNQLPRGLRRSLYVKDDDFRYSVSYGSFVTLSNLTPDDWTRIAEQRLGPLRVSVHTTDPSLRRQMLGNPRAPDVLDQLRRLGELRIRVHAQLVLCPGINDGPHLSRSVADLAALYPTVQSIAVVPVGYTRHHHPAAEHNYDSATRGGDRRSPAVLPRKCGVPLRSFSREEAIDIVDETMSWQRDFRRRLGISLVHLGDEFYFLSGRPFPPGQHYDGYPQYENGIGLVRSLLDEWRRLRRVLPRKKLAAKNVTLLCATRIAPVLAGIAASISANSALKLDVVAVENEFFGSSVNVSGLLTGRDVRRAAAKEAAGEELVLPAVMLDASGERFLDEETPAAVSAALARPVHVARSIGGLLALFDVSGRNAAGAVRTVARKNQELDAASRVA